MGLGVVDRDRGADRDDDSDTSVAVDHICCGLLGSDVVRGIGCDGAMVMMIIICGDGVGKLIVGRRR